MNKNENRGIAHAMTIRLTPNMRSNRESTAAAMRLPNNKLQTAANEAPRVGWQQEICRKGHAASMPPACRMQRMKRKYSIEATQRTAASGMNIVGLNNDAVAGAIIQQQVSAIERDNRQPNSKRPRKPGRNQASTRRGPQRHGQLNDATLIFSCVNSAFTSSPSSCGSAQCAPKEVNLSYAGTRAHVRE